MRYSPPDARSRSQEPVRAGPVLRGVLPAPDMQAVRALTELWRTRRVHTSLRVLYESVDRLNLEFPTSERSFSTRT